MNKNYVIGDPVNHSLSPLIHNAAYKLLKISEEYSFSSRQVRHDKLADFLEEFKDSGNGLAVTIPHKQTVATLLQEIDEAAREIGAVNTVVNKSGTLVGYNTDWIGAHKALESKTDIRGKKVALIGTGGTARAIAYAMKMSECQLTIFGRDDRKTIEISKDFGALPARLQAKPEIATHEIIINSTSVGLDEKTEIELLPPALFERSHVVFDIVYGRRTKFITDAESQGATTINGLEMLIEQAVPQIELHTGHKINSSALRQALRGKL